MGRSSQEPIAIILAGGGGDKLSVLSEKRAVPSVPFAGKYRIIDFTLSNCVNSGLTNVLVLTQYRPLSLHDHIGNGKPWDLDRLHGGVRLVSPYLGPKDASWDRGTADAVYRNLEEIIETPGDTVVILGGDHVYKMDYRPMIEMHQEQRADVTIGVIWTPIEQAHRFGVVTTNGFGRVVGFDEKPAQPKSNLVSMGIYVFNKDVLIKRLSHDALNTENRTDFGRHILPKMIAEGDQVRAYPFEGYWRDIGNLKAYWEANLELLEDQPGFDLYGRDWVIYTRSEERPPALTGSTAQIEGSLISNGCQIHGRVINSVLSPGVIVEEGAVVRDSVIMTDTLIGKNSRIDRAVIDKVVVIGPDSQIGFGDDTTPNTLEPDRLNFGLTLIGKGAHLPAGLKVGRNCKLGSNLTAEHITGLIVASGSSIEAPDLEQ